MIPNLGWLRDAACAGMDDRAFFATGRHARAQVFAAKKVCRRHRRYCSRRQRHCIKGGRFALRKKRKRLEAMMQMQRAA